MRTFFIAGAAASMAIAVAAAPASAANPRGFDDADLNKDGVVSQGEFERTQSFRAQKFFFRADRDNDRGLSPEEFVQVRRFVQRGSYRTSE